MWKSARRTPETVDCYSRLTDEFYDSLGVEGGFERRALLHHPCGVPGQFDTRAERGGVEIREYLNEHEQDFGGIAPNFHRPLSTYVNETIRLGCDLVEMVEPQLPPPRSRTPATSCSRASPTSSSSQRNDVDEIVSDRRTA